MGESKELTLFQVKFKASVKKLEELLAVRDIKNALDLIDKMQKEANRAGIDRLDSFSDKLVAIQQHSLQKVEARCVVFEDLYTQVIEGCEAILHNKFQNEGHKKEVLELLNVQQGMAQYSSPKAYREELIAFCDWFKSTLESLQQLIKYEDRKELLAFLEEFKTKAQKIVAKEILYFLASLHQTIAEDKTQLALWLESYKKSIAL